MARKSFRREIRKMDAAGFDTYDYAALWIDKSAQVWQTFYKRRISEISRYLACEKPKICDVGCGLGDFLGECDKVGWSTFGITLSEREIREAEKRTIAKLAVWDIDNGLPFEESFDVITCFDVLEHLNDPERGLAVINQKLGTPGIFMFNVPSIHFGFYTSKRWEHITHVSLLTIRNWKRITRNSGFRIMSSKTVFPYFSQQEGVKPLLGRLIARMGFGSTLSVIAIKDGLDIEK